MWGEGGRGDEENQIENNQAAVFCGSTLMLFLACFGLLCTLIGFDALRHVPSSPRLHGPSQTAAQTSGYVHI